MTFIKMTFLKMTTLFKMATCPRIAFTAAILTATTAPLVALEENGALKPMVLVQNSTNGNAERLQVLSAEDDSGVLRGFTEFRSGREQANGRQYYLQASPEGSFGINIEVNADGEIEIELNGESIPEDRIRRDGEQLEILDPAGQVLFRFNTLDSQSFSIPLEGLWHDRPELREESKPRPLIGIYMETVSKALAHQLDLPEDAVVVHEVLEGFAAERAGLEQFDVITHVDGEPGVTMASLRKAIADRQEGDVVDLRVIRKGEVRQIPINVEVRSVPSWRHLPGSGPLDLEKIEELEIDGFVDPRGEVLRRMFPPRVKARRTVRTEATLEQLEKRIQELEQILEKLNDH